MRSVRILRRVYLEQKRLAVTQTAMIDHLLKLINQKTRKLITMHKALYSKDDIDCMCPEKKEEEDLPAFKIASMHERLEDYIKKSRGRLITATINNTDNTSINRTKIARKQKWDGYFERQASYISHKKTWTWLRRGNLNKETESLLMMIIIIIMSRC